jgi:hypothetical protein
MSIKDDLKKYVGTKKKAAVYIKNSFVYFLGTILEVDDTGCVIQQVKYGAEPYKIPLSDIESISESFLTDRDIELSYSK